MHQIDKISICEMKSYSRPPESVATAFGIYLRFLLDKPQMNERGIVDYLQVKLYVFSSASGFMENSLAALNSLTTLEDPKILDRLKSMVEAVELNFEKYEKAKKDAFKIS